jgi:tetratricopeptide (TPR) repeat protein
MALVAALLVAPLAVGVASADLVALWEFDRGGGNDSLGGAYGSFNGAPRWVEGREGKGGALKLRGSDFISVDHRSKFDIVEQITLAAWIKVEEFDKDWQSILTKGDTAWRLSRAQNTNTIAFHLTGVTSKNKGVHGNLGVEGRVNVNDGKWHHVAGLYDGSKVYLYVDGVVDKELEAKGKIATNSFDVCIGANSQRPDRGFVGLVDDVAIFNHALSGQEITQLYTRGGTSFAPEVYMTRLVSQIEAAAGSMQADEAIAFLKKKVSEYEQWKAGRPADMTLFDEQPSPDIYYSLARAKEASGAPREDIVAAYKKSVSPVLCRANHVASAFSWLFENTPNEDYVEAAKNFARSSYFICREVYNVTEHFEAADNWDGFRLFLDGLFSEADYGGKPTYYCLAIAGRALEGNEAWTDRLTDYYKGNLELTEYVFGDLERAAEKHTAQNNHSKAAEIYRGIIEQCGPNHPKPKYELKLFKCLLNDGQYESLVPEISRFIKDNKPTQGVAVIEAIMLKGQAHIQMGDIDGAIDTFFTLLIEYPEAKQAVDANFFMGYCYMLQGSFAEAKEAFNIIVKDHPQSQYAARARSYLDRIKGMTQQ